jgi:toxin-antitoxin system PIN domain toxin
VSGYLLDINVIIALIDPSHVHHDRAHAWFAATGKSDWLSSPTTQNGVVRIVSNPKYPNAQTSPAVVIDSLRSLTGVGRHRFVPDDVTLLDAEAVQAEKLLSSGQVTDTYLLALAATARARLATFDTKLVTTAVPSGRQHIVHIP